MIDPAAEQPAPLLTVHTALIARARRGRSKTPAAPVRFEARIVGRHWHQEAGEPPPARVFMLVDDDGSSQPFAVERIEVKHPDSPAFVVGWHDDAGTWHAAMVGGEHFSSGEQVRLAALAFEPVQGLFERGRASLNEEHDALWLRDVRRAEVLKRRQPSLSWKVIAEAHIGVSRKTLDRWRARKKALGF